MIQTIILVTLTAVTISGCNNSNENKITANNPTTSVCSDICKAKNDSTEISCKLTSAEMQQRKAIILESLRKEILEKKELTDGYAFKFNGSDIMFDKLTEFIKTERACCNFFTFNLSVGGDKNEIWLSMTGPKEAKEFIKTELEW